MDWYYIVLIVIASLIVLFFLVVILPLLPFSHKLYNYILTRKDKSKWGRECSFQNDKEQMEMYARGEKWGEEHISLKEEVDIYSDGFHLFGEYYDFGNDKAVIIIPGRCEALRYSYYFAKPYKEAGYNVLVIDNRSHGLSDGEYNNLGIKEYVDIIEWAKLLHDKYNNKKIVCHGICIGSATALYAQVSDKCPEYLSGLVTEGMYSTFYESFKNHMILDKRPLFPVIYEFMFFVHIHSGKSAIFHGPIKEITKIKKPILFLFSKEDKFSLPSKGQLLYDKCGSDNKKLVWFEHGAHSHIRINDEEGYDNSIKEFLSTL